jgi:hypothetical protein
VTGFTLGSIQNGRIKMINALAEAAAAFGEVDLVMNLRTSASNLRR